jgi:FAD/FMN-containing dehydrogenase
MKRRNFCRSSLALVSAGLMLSTRQLYAALTEVGADVEALTLDGTETVLPRSTVQDLAGLLRGSLLLPGNPAYEQARLVRNAGIDKHPALIVQPSGEADVSAAVQFARDRQLVIAVKCGGHSTAGLSTCDGGMMIDLSPMRYVRVNPDERVAYVSGGSLLGAMDHEAMSHGLVTVTGTVSHTGVGGLATGGGFGRLARRWGLTLDNIRAVDVVSADGKLRHASALENQDLYWGVRGAGGNFGVVTSFEFNLQPMSRQVIAGNLVYPIDRLRDVLDFYAEYSIRAPDELQADLVFGYPPAGKPGFVVVALCYSGDPATADKVLGPVKKLGKPLAGELAPTDYVALQRSGDSDLPRVNASYLKGGFIDSIPPALIDALVEGIEPHPEHSAQVIFQQAGGAISRVPADATAFAHRYAEYNMIATMSWQPGADPGPHVRAIKQYWSQLAPFTHGFYVNEVDGESAAYVDRNYQGNYPRLLAIKRRYDPDNNFRLNANIRPMA